MLVILMALLISGIELTSFRNPSGTWQLNWELSEEPAYEDTGFTAPPELLSPRDRLVLTLTATSVTIDDADGARRKYKLSGEKEDSDWRGFRVETRARWNGRTLRIELKPQRGLIVIENYAIDLTTHQLILTVASVQHGSRSGTPVRYVYERVPAH